MSVFSDATIDHFEALGRRKLSTELNLRVVRYSPVITAGTDTITLPADCQDIICITYRGLPLYTIKSRNYMSQGTPFYQNRSIPLGYIFDKITAISTVKLYPIPSESLASGNVDTGVLTSCIITYRALCDASNPCPSWFERRVLKYFIAYNLYSLEGKAQNLKLSMYHKKRFEFRLEHFKTQLVNFYFGPRQLVIQGLSMMGINWRRRNLPVLPARYGRPDDNSMVNR